MNDKLKKAFNTNLLSFIKTGEPICFGRVEGMKEYAKCTGNTEFIYYMEDLLKENSKAIEAKFVSNDAKVKQ